MQCNLHVDYAARDVHEIFLRVEKGARDERKQQKCDNDDRCEQFLNLKALQLLIERTLEVSNQKSV